MELTVISSETIKPSSPTPLSLRKFTLSMLDQKYTPHAVPAIHFYERPPGAAPIDVNRLKICLSQTLSVFYPLAGRVESSSTILCNDEGIPFVEAHVDCTLLSVVESISSVGDIDLKPFYPPRDRLIVDGIQFAIQINVFTCGGFAFAYYSTHKVTDATSVSYFFRYWTELVTQRREYAAQDLADFSSAVKTFPPVPMEEKPVTPKPTLVKQEGHKQGEEEKGGTWSSFFFKNHMVARSFVIRNEAVAKLKAMSISEDVTNPSRFEAVAGFLWKSILANSVDKEGRSVVSLPVDLRARVDPPLPVESMGNLFDRTVIVSEKNVKLHEMVVKIRASILKMKDLAADYQGEKREEAKDGQWKRFVSAVTESKLQDTYLITPWYNKSAGFTKVDFGFGKPKWVIPMDDILNHKQRNMIILMESNDSDGEGFEAWLFLKEKCIKCLESNPEFLALASPNF